jgi:hypothetical protein
VETALPVTPSPYSRAMAVRKLAGIQSNVGWLMTGWGERKERQKEIDNRGGVSAENSDWESVKLEYHLSSPSPPS